MLNYSIIYYLLDFIDISAIHLLPNIYVFVFKVANWGIQIQDLFSLSISFFIGGLFVICINKKNIILLTLGVELMFLGAALLFILFSIILSSPEGQIYALFIFTIAAAESAIVLGLLVAQYNVKKSISFLSVSDLK
jgi:NADH-quinone oxidoreductase subunit K